MQNDNIYVFNPDSIRQWIREDNNWCDTHGYKLEDLSKLELIPLNITETFIKVKAPNGKIWLFIKKDLIPKKNTKSKEQQILDKIKYLDLRYQDKQHAKSNV